VNGLVLRQRVRVVGWSAVTAVAVIVAVVVAVLAPGYPAASVHQLLGQTWLVSSAVGQITLVDGSTGDVAARVPVARASGDLVVAQSDADALVANRSSGLVTRVLGATQSRQQGAVRPLPGAARGLSVYAGTASAYVVDAVQGTAAVLDPQRLSVRGRVLSMAAALDRVSVTVDRADRLWAVDTRTGDLLRVSAAGKLVVPGVTSPGVSPVVLAAGRPVVVDPRQRTVNVVEPSTGRVASRGVLDLVPGERVSVGGSATSGLVFAAVDARGLLLVHDPGCPTCARVVQLGAGTARFGAPVETGGRVFVPDFRTGRVYVIDLSRDRLIASRQVLPPGLPTFDLLTRDGAVFYNDPRSERAGIIRFDGSVLPVRK